MSDLENFLRRLAEQAAQSIEAGSRPPTSEEVVDAEIVDAEVLHAPDVPERSLAERRGIERGDSVSEHVDAHLSSAKFERRTAALGRTIDQSDERIEGHLRDVFEHQLGQFGAQTSQTEESILDPDDVAPKRVESPFDPIFQMLHSPDTLRNAILLSEIIQRPEHRW